MTHDTRPDSKSRLRLWLRLLKAQRSIESALRDRLRAEFGSTLPRFDVLAALDRSKDGLRMSELSSVLKVSNGNVTGIIERLVEDGQVERIPVPGDRRAMQVRLTEKGRKNFATMAAAHEGWVSELLAPFERSEAEALCSAFETLNNRLDQESKP
jgi:DNA-binding MarR family transcriptional regulator